MDHAGLGIGYYDLDGVPLRKMFLRSPLTFSRVTSRFSMNRYHPVLKRRMPHYGVDYGAPVGTPVLVTADGVVALAGRNGGAGNMVRVRHANGYETMSVSIAPGVSTLAFWVAQQILDGADVPKDLTVPFLQINQDTLDESLAATEPGDADPARIPAIISVQRSGDGAVPEPPEHAPIGAAPRDTPAAD